MFRMPVSGVTAEFAQITGTEDMLLLESSLSPRKVCIGLVSALARRSNGQPLDGSALPFPDLEALMLEQRRRLFGDELRARKRCQTTGCAANTEISFLISEYLGHYHPRAARNAEPVEDQPGWYRLRGSTVTFRLVTAGDVAAAQNSTHPEAELKRRTIRPDNVSSKDVVRAQAAMQSLAPSLSRELIGRCPECGAAVRYWFDPLLYVCRELSYEAEFLYHEVHLLAARYHWPEEKILALPRSRRAQYAEFAMSAGGRS